MHSNGQAAVPESLVPSHTECFPNYYRLTESFTNKYRGKDKVSLDLWYELCLHSQNKYRLNVLSMWVPFSPEEGSNLHLLS